MHTPPETVTPHTDHVHIDSGTLATRVAGARHSLRYSQPTLAAAAGLSAATIRAIEQGRRKCPTGATLLALARSLHASPDWLLTGRCA